MLLVKGEPFSLSDRQKKDLMDKVGIKDFKPDDFQRPFTIKVKYLDGMVIPNRKDPKKFEKPASLSVPAKSSNVRITGLGSGKTAAQEIVPEVIYYETAIAHESLPGEKVYSPKHIEVKDGQVIYDNQSNNRDKMMELLWYFVNASTQCKDSDNFNTNTSAGFRIWNPVKIASDGATKSKEDFKIQKLLFGEQGEALTDGLLKGLAKSMFIPMADTLTPDEIRMIIKQRIEHKEEGPVTRQTLLKFQSTEGERMFTIRKTVMTAVEGKVIGFNSGEACFHYISGGKQGTKICVVKEVINETKRLEELCDHFAYHTDQFAQLAEKMAPAMAEE